MIYQNPRSIVRIVTPVEELPETVVFRMQEANIITDMPVETPKEAEIMIDITSISSEHSADISTDLKMINFHPDLI